jgi:hypothetical protein
MPIVDGSGEAVPGHRPIDETDLEISYNLRGEDLILRVNKAGVLVFRVGDTAEGIDLLVRGLGLTGEEAARARARLSGDVP